MIHIKRKKTMSKDIVFIKHRIENEADYIYCPRLSNSLSNLLSKNPGGISDERIMKVLLINEQELKEVYESALNKLRKHLKVEK